MSGHASRSIEDIAAARREGQALFYQVRPPAVSTTRKQLRITLVQLYLHRDRSKTEETIRKIDNLEFKAVILTVDAPVIGKREQDMRNALPVNDDPVCFVGSFIPTSHSRRWLLDREWKKLGRAVWRPRCRPTSKLICSGQMWPGLRFANKSHLAAVVIEMVVLRAPRSFQS